MHCSLLHSKSAGGLLTEFKCLHGCLLLGVESALNHVMTETALAAAALQQQAVGLATAASHCSRCGRK
jgi:hypothetical protein